MIVFSLWYHRSMNTLTSVLLLNFMIKGIMTLLHKAESYTSEVYKENSMTFTQLIAL